MQGCAGEDDHGVVDFRITTEAVIPHEVDEIDMAITGSRTTEGTFCSPATHSFSLENSRDIPLRISIDIGETYNEWLATRVIGRLRGDEVFRRYGRHSLSAVTATEISIVLGHDCYRRLCSRDHHCQDGVCLATPAADAFNPTATYDEVHCELPDDE